MKLDVKNCGNLRLVGFKITTTISTAAQDIPQLWAKLYQARKDNRLPEGVGAKPFAVYHHYKHQNQSHYTYFVGFPMEQPTISVLLDTELEMAYVPYSRYAVFRASGSFPDRMLSIWNWIWKQGSLNDEVRHSVEVYPEATELLADTELEFWVNLDAQTQPIDEVAMNQLADYLHYPFPAAKPRNLPAAA